MIDASVLVDALAVVGPAGESARASIRAGGRPDAPQHLKAEAASALRAMERRNTILPHRARSALDAVRRFPVQSHPMEPLLARIWELRDNLTIYDAWYIALAEQLNTTLVTADRHLAAAPGPRCNITVV